MYRWQVTQNNKTVVLGEADSYYEAQSGLIGAACAAWLTSATILDYVLDDQDRPVRIEFQVDGATHILEVVRATEDRT